MTLLKFSNVAKPGVLRPSYHFKSLYDADSFSSKSMVSSVPAVNVSETDNTLLIELAVPGLKKSDFKINLEENRLTISMVPEADGKEKPELKNYNRREFNYQSFSRTFILPESADSSRIFAEYIDGILLISVSKKEEVKRKSRDISVK